MQIGERMKSYETDYRLDKGAVIIRVDGKNFHTWTEKIGANKPFDYGIRDAMLMATARTSNHMQGFKLAYTQSDESTFLLMNTDEKAQGWFDYKVQKLTSITASYFTYYFNQYNHGQGTPPAFFDARAFNVPIDDVANNFVWRQQDWKRNSIQMVAQTYFSHKELQGLNNDQVMKKLESIGKQWDLVPSYSRFGTFICDTKFGKVAYAEHWDYDKINEMVGINVYTDN